jgi:hypothetical protein
MVKIDIWHNREYNKKIIAPVKADGFNGSLNTF